MDCKLLTHLTDRYKKVDNLSFSDPFKLTTDVLTSFVMWHQNMIADETNF